jgi:hypothetical protein
MTTPPPLPPPIEQQRCAAALYGEPFHATRCPNTGRIRIPCPSCGYVAFCCTQSHVTGAWQVAYGHRLREHPETMPAELDRLRRSPSKLDALKAAERERPGTFTKLFATLAALNLHNPPTT